MKEQLISFETAKLAKKKGLNLESHQYYHNSPHSIIWDSMRMEQHNNTEHNHIDHLLIITQSLLQKWLREKYLIHIIISPSFSYVLVKLKSKSGGRLKNTKTPFGKIITGFNLYEEALEKGLQEALKLIK